ncbi:MAG: thiamine phosphate synthase [Marinilabiliaceae bacterium]|nr:thiamine phosphate synthase [Marinilabiliaceae bacterium]
MNSLIIAITLPNIIINEHQIIESLLENGIDYVHVRKPGWINDDIEKWIEKISPQCHNKLTVHYHHHLAKKYNIGGVHQSRGFELNDNYEHFRKSLSCHSIREMMENCHDYDYMFISPVFDSISKTGYKSGINYDELLRVLKHPGCQTDKAIALGGISINTINQAKYLGFKNIALLGGLWEINSKQDINCTKTLNNLKKIVNFWKQ